MQKIVIVVKAPGGKEGGGGAGVLPIMAYTGRPRPKGVSFHALGKRKVGDFTSSSI